MLAESPTKFTYYEQMKAGIVGTGVVKSCNTELTDAV